MSQRETAHTELEEGQFKDAEVKTSGKTNNTGLPLCRRRVLSVPSKVYVLDTLSPGIYWEMGPNKSQLVNQCHHRDTEVAGAFLSSAKG